tara:strand:+ start:3733 stop:4083 length:351 start_codon:yes stop_codon:yes gene_type:complete
MNTTGKKYGGRVKGTPNKVTAELRSKIGDIIDVTLESLDLDTLSKMEKIKLLQVCLQYAIPKLQSQVIDLNTEERLQQVEITIVDGENKEEVIETLSILDETDLGLAHDLNKIFHA